jgi:hypothetical protein
MAGEKRYTRIPPESTGDRVYMVHTAEIEYKNFNAVAGGSTTHVWQIGQRYDIAGFGGGGKVHVHGVFDRGDGTGILAVHYNKTAKFENLTPTADALISYNSQNISQVVIAYDVYIPTQNIMGYDNPEYGLDIDIRGSANVRFAEGQPQLDAWGKLRVSGATQLGDYVFSQQSIVTNNFSPVEIDGGYSSWDGDRKSVRVGVDTLASDFNAAAGFSALTSNQYHHYFPGSSHLYMGTALLNSPETTGSTRRWGLFDADNGFFFVVGTGGANAVDDTGFSVVIRSNATLAIADRGSKDLYINRADWNGDKLDGTGDSQEIVDLAKDNIWWIDVQWHGAGRVRFGTYVDGQRVVCHSYYHGNRYNYAMTQTASLPTCVSNKSSGSTTTNLYVETWSSSVWTESDIDLRETGIPNTYGGNHVAITANISDAWQPVFSLSPTEQISAGVVNHSLYVPTRISAYAFDSVTGNEAIIDLKSEINSVHTGHSFSNVPGTNIDVSTSGTSFEGGKINLQDMFKGRFDQELTDTYNNLQNGAVKNLSEDGGTKSNSITGISAASTAVVTIGESRINLREPQSVNFPLNTNRYGGKVEIFGSTNANYNGLYYLKITSLTTAELYTDEALTVPVNSTTFGAFTGTATLKGFQGSRVIWTFYAKTRTALFPNAKLMINVNWKEITQ